MTSQEITNKYGLTHVGKVKEINKFASLNNSSQNTIVWCKTQDLLTDLISGTVLLPFEFKKTIKPNENATYLFCKKSPRLIFAKVLRDFFASSHLDDFTNCVAKHRNNTKIKIGENCFIGTNVIIGNGTEILHNTSIFSNTKIGENCLINCNCSISTPGLGFEYDGAEIVKFPQFGGVTIGKNVELGPSSTVRRGTLGDTIIGDNTKIGSLSNIGHNSEIGKQCILTCQVVIGGSSIIGDRAYMGIGSATRNKVKIGNDVTVGMGAMVISNIPSNSLAIGVPAKDATKK